MSSPKQSRNRSNPRRVLILFLVGVIALYVIVALVGLGGKKSDDSAWKPKLGLDLQGGTSITLQAKTPNGKAPDKAKLDQARDIIEQRVNGTGVTESEVTTQAGNQIIIEIPGKQKQNIVDQVGKTAQLRFRLLWGTPTPSTAKVDTAALQKQVDAVDWNKLTLDQMIKAETGGVTTLPKSYTTGLEALSKLGAAFKCTPDGLATVNDVASRPLVTCDPATKEIQVLSPAAIEGSSIKSATPQIPTNSVQWVVSIALKGEGKSAFTAISKALYAQQTAGSSATSRFAVVLDGESITSPTMNGLITDGQSQISGNFTASSAKALADQLKYGALPLTFTLNSSEYEGPTLAGSQLHAGLLAGLVGLLLVVIYCLLYYRGLGLVVVASLVAAGVVTYAAVLLLGKGMGFALSLPGIAGFIVAIGITADSFIVYFERLRDEVRDGKSLRLAVESGWVRARGTILAADAVSFLAALVLYIFAIGVVRGFAFALGLSTLIDVVIVFLFTKPLVTLLARTKFFGQGHKLSGLDSSHLGIGDRKVTEIARTPGGQTS